MEMKIAMAGLAPVPGSCIVNISVEFGHEGMTFSVIELDIRR